MIQILKQYRETESYIVQVKTFADQHKTEFGFLPESVYYDQAFQDKLWIAVDPSTRKLAGYVMFGGKYPNLKVFQMFVSSQHRGKGVGKSLLKGLVEFAEARSFLSIKVRVASDLIEADLFWQRNKFELVEKVKGGITTKRIIHIRVRDLATVSLLSLLKDKENERLVHYSSPLVETPLYILDLNVVFDVIKKRSSSNNASELISAALNNQLKLNVTTEFVCELKRNKQHGEDPILKFAQTLPTVRKVASEELQEIYEKIRPLVFPNFKESGKKTLNNNSDLIHLATSIFYSVKGFITRDKAILRASYHLEKDYGIEVLSPSDFFQPFNEDKIISNDVLISSTQQSLQIKEASDESYKDFKSFLEKQGLNGKEIIRAWSGEVNSSFQRRLLAFSSKEVIAVAMWDIPKVLATHITLCLYVNERNQNSERIIDHVLELCSRDLPYGKLMKINLVAGLSQQETLRTAKVRGYILDDKSSLVKVAMNGLVNKSNWQGFCDSFFDKTGIRLPIDMPTYDEVQKNGLTLSSGSEKKVQCNVFDFETMLSPLVFLWQERGGVIVPIQPSYSADLLGKGLQGNLFPSKEALLHVEKAYFRSPARASYFSKGKLVFLYESGKNNGRKQMVGVGRIVFSEVMKVDKIGNKFSRQGVIPNSDLNELADKKGDIHVFTFDSFTVFPQILSFNYLRERGCVSKANLVTAEMLGAREAECICRDGFGSSSLL